MILKYGMLIIFPQDIDGDSLGIASKFLGDESDDNVGNSLSLGVNSHSLHQRHSRAKISVKGRVRRLDLRTVTPSNNGFQGTNKFFCY